MGVSNLGFCLIALLMEDLFPTDNPKSYVAGEADRSNRYEPTVLPGAILYAMTRADVSGGLRSGVFSFSRFHPDYFTDEEDLRRLAPSEKAVLLRRSCKLMVHEVPHLFVRSSFFALSPSPPADLTLLLQLVHLFGLAVRLPSHICGAVLHFF